MTRAGIRAQLPWAATLAILAASGVIQGRLDGRWSSSPSLDAAVGRIGRLPGRVGPWAGEDGELDQVALRRAGIAGGLLRRYRDAGTGALVSVLLVCGRPGPISVHTPEVCYAGAGFELAAPPSTPIPGFLAARMVREGPAALETLQVCWSWNASGAWEAPANPRLAFGARPFLYKLYVVGSPGPAGEDLEAGPAVGFARALAATLDLRAAP